MGAGTMEQKKTSPQLTGMTCAACANRIEKGLSKMEGVQEANVNFALEKRRLHLIRTWFPSSRWKKN